LNIKREIYTSLGQGAELFKVILMWSFPVVSLLLGFLSWKKTVSKTSIIVLSLGLGLQSFAYTSYRFTSLTSNYPLVSMGRGLLVGFLLILLSGFTGGLKPDQKSRVDLKVMILVGLIFLTMANLIDPKFAEAVLAILCILTPAIFWREISFRGPAVVFSVFFISTMAFTSFILTWSQYLLDAFDLSPLLWMMAFTAGYYLSLNFEVEE